MIRVAGVLVFFVFMVKGVSFGEASVPESYNENTTASVVETVRPVTENAELAKSELAEQILSTTYTNIFGDSAKKPSYTVFRKGMIGYLNLLEQGKLKNKDILTLIDFSLPSAKKRLWVVDLKKQKVLFYDLVAHGKNSGGNMATTFSNTHNSNMSSLGFYVTANKYYGKHGLSLRLAGQEAGYNSNAMGRAVVMHGADYVNEDIIRSIGRLGRSFGCPAISKDIYQDVINTVAEGSCMFIYHPSTDYHTASTLLKEKESIQDILLAGTY